MRRKNSFSSSVFFLIHFIYGSYTIWKHFSFFAASSFLPVSYESAKACAVVVENDSSSSSSSQISTKNAITNLNSHNPQSRNSQTVDYGKQGSSSSSTYLSQVPDLSGKIRIYIYMCVYITQQSSIVTHCNARVYCCIGNYQGMQQQQPRNLPPDGTTFNQISLGKRLKQILPPYGYWNMQFYQVSLLFAN